MLAGVVPVYFDAYAVPTARGPHVTLQAGTVHLGRHWTTTSRSSLKVRAIGRVGRAAWSRRRGTRTTISSGRARVLDPLRPWTLAGMPLEAGLAGGAVLRLGAEQVGQVLGYAEAGGAVPPDFAPWGRVLLITNCEDSLVLDGSQVVSAGGQWAPGGELPATGGEATPPPQLSDVPPEVAHVVGSAAASWLGVRTSSGPVALPATWDGAAGTARVPTGAVAAVGAVIPGQVSITLDDSSSRRPDRKVGAMLRGDGAAVDLDGESLVVGLVIDRVTWWSGFMSGTSTVAV